MSNPQTSASLSPRRSKFCLLSAAAMLVALGAASVALADKPVRPDYSPPPDSAIPSGPFGDIVRKGQMIFTDTAAQAPQFVGNDLKCSNCHLNAGRTANAAPLGPAYLLYPAFRKKDGKVDNFSERLRQCFRYSMNGKEPPLDDEVLTALESYAYFLAKGYLVGIAVQGQGYMKLAPPPQPASYARGETVFAQKCASCHGKDGAGKKIEGRVLFPPVWGPRSYNWGAGMTSIANAAGFIKANMPLGQGGTLSDQEAWDAAIFVDSHDRPQDPRFTGDVAETRRRFHDSPMSMYGEEVNGHVLGASADAGPGVR